MLKSWLISEAREQGMTFQLKVPEVRLERGFTALTIFTFVEAMHIDALF